MKTEFTKRIFVLGMAASFFFTTISMAQQSTVSTYAGTGIPGFTDGAALTQAQFQSTFGMGVCSDNTGTIYVADRDNHAVRKIDNGIVTTLAGNGTAGYADGVGANAQFYFPNAVAADDSGNVYVCDWFNAVIRKITPAGVVTTYAGTAGVTGYQDGPASQALFYAPTGITSDASGNLYVSDGSQCIRKITADGTVSTYAGQFNSFQGGYVDGFSTIARFDRPSGLAFDQNGNLYVAEESNHAIRKITPGGVVSTVAGVGHAGAGPGSGGFADGNGLTVAEFNTPSGVVVDGAGNIFVADQCNNRIRKIATDGTVTTLAGSGAVGCGYGGYAEGPGDSATFNQPYGICHDVNGNLFVADINNYRIRKIANAISIGLQIDTTIYINVEFLEDSVANVFWNSSSSFSVTKYILEFALDGTNFGYLDSISTDTLKDIYGLNPNNVDPFSGILYTTEGGSGFIFNHIIHGYLDSFPPVKYRVKIFTGLYRLYSVDKGVTHIFTDDDDGDQICIVPPSPIISCTQTQTPPVGWIPTTLINVQRVGCCIVTSTLFQDPLTFPPCTIPTVCGPRQYCFSPYPVILDCNLSCCCRHDPCCCHTCGQYKICGCKPWDDCGTPPIVQWVITKIQSDFITGDDFICLGESTTLTATAGIAVNWIDEFNNDYGNTFSITVSPAVTTTYCATIHVSPAQTISCCVTVTVISNVVDAGPDQTITCGSSAQLSATITPPLTTKASISWTPVAGLDDPTILTPIASPLTTTTYTITVTTKGCSFSDAVTITVQQTDFASAGSDVPICQGTSTQLTASGGVSYLWSPSAGLSCIACANTTSSPLATTTYTVTVTDANGCTDADDVIVTVYPAPGAAILTYPSLYVPITCDNSIVYYVQTIQTGYTYQWSATNGTASCVNAACTTATVSWTDQSLQGTVSLTVTDLNGCTATSSINVMPCCNCSTVTNDIEIENITAEAFAIQQNLSGTGTIADPYVYTNNLGANGTLYIRGVFIVNLAFEFRNALVKMGPGAKIIIPSYSGTSEQRLNVICSNIGADCCNKMWDGIYIYPDDRNNRLFMDGGTSTNSYCTPVPCTTYYVRDAENAVVSVNGGFFELYCYKYLNNYKDVWVQTYTGIHPSSGLIQSCTFTTQGGLISPRSGQRGHIGVELTRVIMGTGFDVGKAGAAFTNTFDNLDIGIRVDKSNVNVYNNVFQSITQSCVPSIGMGGPTICPVIACIYATGLPRQAAAHTLKVGSGSNADKNILKNSTNGIWVENSMNMIIKNNHFINVKSPSGFPGNLIPSRCIFSRDQWQSNIAITNANKFNKFNTGVFILNPVAATTTTIQFNYFNAGSSTNPDEGDIAIRVQSAILGSTGKAIISLNNIRRVRIGVWVTDNTTNAYQTFVDIFNNTIAFIGPKTFTRYGILAERSSANIYQNNISFIGTQPSSANLIRGIQITRSPISFIHENNLTKLGSGIRFFANSIPSFSYCNVMDKCYNGVHLEGATIGDQLPSSIVQDNQWKNTQTSTNGLDIYSNLVGPPPDWYYRTTDTKYNPNPFTAQGILDHAISGNPFSVCPPPPCANPPCEQAQLSKILTEPKQFPAFANENIFSEKEHVFRQLKKNPSLMQLGTPDDTLLQYFNDSVLNTNIGKIVELEEAVTANNNGLALQKWNSIIPNCLIEENYKKAYDVYLRTWAEEIYEINTADKITLLNVAVQNALTGGGGVFTARVMLDTLIDDEISMPSMKKSNNKNNESVEVLHYASLMEESNGDRFFVTKLFPNPSNGEFQLNYKLKEGEGVLKIFNLLGGEEAVYKFRNDLQSLTVSQRELTGGIYLYEVRINNEVYYTGKLVIIK